MDKLYYFFVAAGLLLIFFSMFIAISIKNIKLKKEAQELKKLMEDKEKEQEQKNETLTKQFQLLSEKFDQCMTRTSDMLSHDSICPKMGADQVKLIDIIEIAKTVVQELASDAEQHHIRIDVSTPHDKLFVYADTYQLSILFKNIIDNSIKYMKRAGVLVITISKIGDEIFIILKDNGNGLSKEEIPHVFELNFQGSNRVSGNGLGLTQAKAIVEAYGGEISARSDDGMGIYIQIPFRSR